MGRLIKLLHAGLLRRNHLALLPVGELCLLRKHGTVDAELNNPFIREPNEYIEAFTVGNIYGESGRK